MIRGIKYVMIFTVGAAIGGSVGWFITKKKFEKTMDERIEQEVLETRRYWQNYAREGKFETKAEKDIPETNPIADYVNAIDESDEIEEAGYAAVESYTDRMNRRKEDLLRPERTKYDRSEASKSERIQYNSFSKPKPESEEKEVDEVRLAQNDDDPRSDIYVINADQFAHERYGFDKVTLYWWELERILSEEDMAILDVPDILGTNWEAHIGEEEKDIVYVRNEPLETDYEVVAQHESFYAMRDS